jgi:hypothetical protein
LRSNIYKAYFVLRSAIIIPIKRTESVLIIVSIHIKNLLAFISKMRKGYIQ